MLYSIYGFLAGDVPRVNGQLAVARAFGDQSLKAHLSSEPDIRHVPINSSIEFVILASDGLWKVSTRICLLTVPFTKFSFFPMLYANVCTLACSYLVLHYPAPGLKCTVAFDRFLHYQKHISYLMKISFMFEPLRHSVLKSILTPVSKLLHCIPFLYAGNEEPGSC